MVEIGLRSYFREYRPDLTLLDPSITTGSPVAGKEMTEGLSRQHSDLIGLFVSGNGFDAAISAVKQDERSDQLAVVGFGSLEAVRTGLIDGTVQLAITLPLHRLASEAIGEMVCCLNLASTSNCFARMVPFEIRTRENM